MSIRRVGVFVAVLSAVAFAVPATSQAAATPLPSDAVVFIQGHGWGHGRGLGQWGAKGMADAGKTWTQIVSHYYSGVTIGTRTAQEPVRVHLETSADTLVSSDAVFSVAWRGGATIGSSDATFKFWRARHNGTSYIVEKAAQYTGPWTHVATGTVPVWFRPGASLVQLINSAGAVRYYRGFIESRYASGTSLYAINELGMQHYLYEVVPREMPASWTPEAVKAQTVAARSYTAYKKDAARARGAAFDICSTTSCQVYGGYAYKSSPSSTTLTKLEHSGSNSAVDATPGKVLLSGGKPILSEYSSSTGGYSAPGTVSYLSPVSDPGDAASPHHLWDARLRVSEIQSAWPEIGRLTDIRVTKRNGFGDWGGRVLEMQLVGTSATKTLSGWGFQSKFAWPARSDGMESNWFRVIYYRGDLAAAPNPPLLVTGGSGAMTVLVRNTGNFGWPIGGGVRLATPAASKFFGTGWISSTRPSTVVRNVTTPDRKSILPGEVAAFSVVLHAESVAPGSHRETFRVVADGTSVASAWFAVNVPVLPALVGVVRGNTWYLNSGGDSRPDIVVSWGRSTDIPVAGDWNGDGTDTPGLVRGSTWYLDNGFDGRPDIVLTWGRPTDVPVVGDWNGDGKDTPGIVRGNTWYLDNGFDGRPDAFFSWGRPTDKPVAGDWNGDGKDTAGLVRDGRWYLDNQNDGRPDIVFTWGHPTDIPITGDWDADGDDTPGLVRDGYWYLNTGFDTVADIRFTFGRPDDRPVVGRWVKPA